MTTTSPALPGRLPSPVASILPDAELESTPVLPARPATPCADQRSYDAQRRTVGATPCDRHTESDARARVAVTTPCADHPLHEAHPSLVGAHLNGSHCPSNTQTRSAAVELFFCAAFLDDIEGLRISTENRLRSLTAEGLDATIYARQLDALARLEHEATFALQRAVRVHPLGSWIKRTKGIGEKQGARLIAAIGQISWNTLEDRPRRGPAELWAYCGYVPGQKRRKGVKSNWSAEAKMRAFLAAEAAVKAGVRKLDECDDSDGYDLAGRVSISPYGAIYLAARANWADRDTSDGHKHNHALRVVAKAILRDLFLEARKVGA